MIRNGSHDCASRLRSLGPYLCNSRCSCPPCRSRSIRIGYFRRIEGEGPYGLLKRPVATVALVCSIMFAAAFALRKCRMPAERLDVQYLGRSPICDDTGRLPGRILTS